MATAGILMHSRHLEAVGWQRLVWGVPESDSLGSLPKVVELLLDEPADEPITTIVFGCGPSEKHGLAEGQYAKQYLLEHLDELRQFPRFRDRLNTSNLAQLKIRLEKIVVEKIERSIDEVVEASRIFAEHQVTKVFQVTSASHGPRCVQIQAAAKAKGLIPTNQQWFLVTDDRCYEGADPFSTLVMEPPHRGDDPMIGAKPLVSETLRAYQYGLSPESKKELAHLVEDFMNVRAEHSEIRNLSRSK